MYALRVSGTVNMQGFVWKFFYAPYINFHSFIIVPIHGRVILRLTCVKQWQIYHTVTQDSLGLLRILVIVSLFSPLPQAVVVRQMDVSTLISALSLWSTIASLRQIFTHNPLSRN